MAQSNPMMDKDHTDSIDLESELHEGDGKVPAWLWGIVFIVVIFGVLFAPFQLYWPFG